MKVALLLSLLLLQQAPTPLFRANINFVELDVSVLDEDRRPVLGLTAADFTVLEDGVMQKVETFEAVVLPDATPQPAPWWGEVPADVATNDTRAGGVFVIVLDVHDAALLYRTKDIARSLIDRLGPGDQMAVSSLGFSGTSQEFTDDEARLRQAVDRFQPLSIGMDQTCTAVDVLTDIARLLEPFSGRRKTMFLLSEQVPAFGPPSDPCFHPMLAFFAAAQRAHVNVYTINPRGLTGWADATNETEADASAAHLGLRNQVAGERTLAENTGGTAITQTNLFDENISRAWIENRAYYLIGYHSTNASTEARLRKLDVRVARDGVTVRTRSGYVPRTAPEPAATADTPPIVAALTTATAAALPATGLPLEATVMPYRTAEGMRLAIVTSVRAGGSATSVQVRATRVDRFGEIKETTERRVALPRDTGAHGTRVVLVLPARPGRQQVRVAAATDDGAAGSAFVDIEVPDARRDRLSMSGVAIHVRADGPALALADLEAVWPFTPTTRRVFRQDEHVTAAVRVYARRIDAPIDVVCDVQSAAGLVRAGNVRLEATRAMSPEGGVVSCAVPLAGLEPGPAYLLVRAEAGGRAVERRVRFLVERASKRP